MAGTNQFYPFATGGSANTLSNSAWAALTSLLTNGFQSGVASSQQINTALRQTSFVAAAIGQFIANNGFNANDDTVVANFVTAFSSALSSGWGMAMSIGSTGYITLPGGLIVQWGNSATNSSGVGNVTFPIVFPTAVLQTFFSERASGADPTIVIDGCTAGTTTGFTLYCTTPSYGVATTQFGWLVIGY